MKDKRLVAFERLLDIMDQLREKCPWDREQTIESLCINTIEETYELVDAITKMDYDEIREELGDLMLHIVFYSKIADQQGKFGITDVLTGISDKLVYRHPHVFGKNAATTSDEVRQNWEQIKLTEGKQTRGVLDGVPTSLPAMVKAYRINEKVAAIGFDWAQREDVWEKVREETRELEVEIKRLDTEPPSKELMERAEHEMGDLLCSIINAARLYNIDPELALEKCNQRFTKRFRYIEKCAEEAGKQISEVGLEQMNEWWNEAKKFDHFIR